MGRHRRLSLYPICLSPSALADAMTLPVKQVRAAIEDATLPAFEDPRSQRIRICIEDAVRWVHRWPRATIRRVRQRLEP